MEKRIPTYFNIHPGARKILRKNKKAIYSVIEEVIADKHRDKNLDLIDVTTKMEKRFKFIVPTLPRNEELALINFAQFIYEYNVGGMPKEVPTKRVRL